MLCQHISQFINVAQCSSYIALCFKELFESLSVAAVSPLHKIILLEKFNRSLAVKSSLSP